MLNEGIRKILYYFPGMWNEYKILRVIVVNDAPMFFGLEASLIVVILKKYPTPL